MSAPEPAAFPAEHVVDVRPSGLGSGHSERLIRDLLHDLRAPLRGVLGFVDALREDCAGQLDERGIDYLTRISRGAERMDQILADVRDLAKLSVAPVVPEPCDLADVIDGAVVRWRHAAREGAAEIVTDIPAGLAVTTDRRLLAQVLARLLDNAAVYVADGVTPRVVVTARRHAGEVAVSVRDNGIGIAAEDRVRVFEPFTRLHGEELYAGSGVGLAAVARLAEMLRCRLAVAPAEGGGTVFTLLIPENPPTTPEPVT